jgi:hypothetical protein
MWFNCKALNKFLTLTPPKTMVVTLKMTCDSQDKYENVQVMYCFKRQQWNFSLLRKENTAQM